MFRLDPASGAGFTAGAKGLTGPPTGTTVLPLATVNVAVAVVTFFAGELTGMLLTYFATPEGTTLCTTLVSF
jgi:hypothetical protein